MGEDSELQPGLRPKQPEVDEDRRDAGALAGDFDGDPTRPVLTTASPSHLQSALLELRDVSKDVYLVQVVFTEAATEEDRAALVAGLADDDTALTLLEATESTGLEHVLEFVIAPKCAIETVTGAIERCTFVDRVTGHPMVTGDDPAEPGEGPPPTAADFETYLETVDTVRAEELLEDPEYVDLLESHDEFSLPEDEFTLIEVLDGACDDPEPEREWFGENADEPADASVGDDADEEDGGLEVVPPSSFPRAPGDSASPESNCAEGRETTTSRGSTPADAHVEPGHSPRGERPGFQADGSRDETSADGSQIDGESTLDLRVRYLESRFSELAAYADSMDELLERQASHRERFEEIELALEGTVDEIERESNEQRRMHASLHEAVEHLEERFEELRDDVDSFADWRARVTAATQE